MEIKKFDANGQIPAKNSDLNTKLNVDEVGDDFDFIRQMLKNNVKYLDKSMAVLADEIAFGGSEVLLEQANNLATLSNATVANLKLLAGTHRDLPLILLSVKKLQDAELSDVIDATEVVEYVQSTAEIIKRLSIKTDELIDEID